jgi:hypothetical protein
MKAKKSIQDIIAEDKALEAAKTAVPAPKTGTIAVTKDVAKKKMGRPTTNPPSTQTSFNLPDEMQARLAAEAKLMGWTKSLFIIRMFENYMAEKYPAKKK